MTQTTTDYLFQATTAVPDRSYSATATNGLGRFDDHLSQASSLASGDSQGFGGGTQGTDTFRRGDDSSTSNSGTASSYSNGSASSSPMSRSDQDDSRDTTSSSSGSSDSSRSDEHDNDKSNDTTAAEAAGASQPVKQSAKPIDSKSEHSEKSETSEAVKAGAVNKNTADLNGDNKSNGSGDGKTATNAPVTDVQHAQTAAKLAVKVADDEAKFKQNAESTNAAENKSKQEKQANNGAAKVTAKSKASGDCSNSDATVPVTGNGETATNAATKEQAKSDAAAAVAAGNAAKRASDSDDTSDGDSKDAQADARSGARNDTVTAAAKVDAAQLAAGAANSPNANPNASPKGKDDSTAAKPIEAKGEAPAVAFARMSRSNNSDASSSANGANEGPQVDPSRFIGRVTKAFQTAQDRGGTLQLRLSPPELGALRIELNVKDGVMSASLQTENANARKLLLDHLPALRDRLAEQNIRVDRFDVDVRQDGSGAQADARGWQQQQPQHQPDQSSPRRQTQTQPKASATTPERVASASRVGDTGLNLIV